MARKTGSHSQITGPRVREAALRLIARHGFAAVSMRQIAADVGVQAGALYNYIPDKQALLFELMKRHMDDLLAAHPDHADDQPLRLICLDQLSDPRNVGAIMRSALALGATAIITTHRHAPEESGALARAAAGALERLPMIRVVNLARAIEQLQKAGIIVAGLAAEGEDDVDMLADEHRLAIVMGAPISKLIA